MLETRNPVHIFMLTKITSTCKKSQLVLINKTDIHIIEVNFNIKTCKKSQWSVLW